MQIAGRCVEFKVPVRLGSFGKQDIESVGGSAVVPHSDRASLPERVGDIRRTGTALGARPTITGLAAVGRSAALNGKQLAELCAAGKQSAAVVRFKGYGHGKTVIQLHLRIRHTRLTVACRTDTDHAERVHHIGIHMLDGQHDRCSVLSRHSRSYTCAVIKQVLLCYPTLSLSSARSKRRSSVPSSARSAQSRRGAAVSASVVKENPRAIAERFPLSSRAATVT